MTAARKTRLLRERAIASDRTKSSDPPAGARPVRSVTVNLAESPLGWLFSRGLLTQRQFDAGERLRWDWERSQLAPRVTMAWDTAPMTGGRGGSAPRPELTGAQIDARRRFDAAIASAGRTWPTSCGGSSAPAKACARRKARSAGLPGRASWC
jgi:hypothetical protein